MSQFDVYQSTSSWQVHVSNLNVTRVPASWRYTRVKSWHHFESDDYINIPAPSLDKSRHQCFKHTWPQIFITGTYRTSRPLICCSRVRPRKLSFWNQKMGGRNRVEVIETQPRNFHAATTTIFDAKFTVICVWFMVNLVIWRHHSGIILPPLIPAIISLATVFLLYAAKASEIYTEL